MPKYLIIGQGLAGTLIAWELFKRNQSFLIIDDKHQHSCSKVAAGIINPITGKRFVESWKFKEFYNFAKETYHDIEKEFNVPIFHPTKILRTLNDNDIEILEKQPQSEYITRISNNKTSIQISPAARLDIPTLLQTLQSFFKSKNLLFEEKINYKNIQVSTNKISYNQFAATHIIFCDGHQVINNPWFNNLPFNPAKGEILTIKHKLKLDDNIIINKKWFVPQNSNQTKVGSNYEWKDLSLTPNQNIKNELIEAFSKTFNTNDIDCVNHEIGVRPSIHDQKPVLGSHQEFKNLFVFNGLGSKGSLWGPWCADHLANHLINDQPIDTEVSIKRFKK